MIHQLTVKLRRKQFELLRALCDFDHQDDAQGQHVQYLTYHQGFKTRQLTALAIYRERLFARRHLRYDKPIYCLFKYVYYPLFHGHWDAWSKQIKRCINAMKKIRNVVLVRYNDHKLARYLSSKSTWHFEAEKFSQPRRQNLVLEIGIVLFNNPAWQVQSCLQSLKVALQHCYLEQSVRVKLLDNGQNRVIYSNSYDWLDYQIAPYNLGFAKAHNQLMSRAFAEGADVYIAMNPDGRAHPEMLKNLLILVEDTQQKSLIECLQFPCEHPKPYHKETWETPWASGACMAITKTIYHQVGGFDESFFMYCEDVDLSWRVRSAGLSVKTAANALFLHRVSNRNVSAKKEALMYGSAIQLGIKWNNPSFVQFAKKKLGKIGCHLSNNEIAVVPLSRQARQSSWFRNDLSFCKPRW